MIKILIKSLLILVLFFSQQVNAQNTNLKPLRVSVTFFTPPFIISNGYNNYMGFDVNMLSYICYYLKRDCQFEAMEFADLIPSIINNQSDIAVGGVIITPSRLLEVAMSNPYLVSASRFITYQENNVSELTTDVLENKRIGVESGSVFGEQLKTWKINGVEIVEYSQEADEVQALIQHNIDFAIMDNYSSIYWVNHSEKKLKLLGKSIVYGYGYGIAINPNNVKLIEDINAAINAYIRSTQYKENYNLYLLEF